ncbi:MAG: FAD-dependent oxidoreductase [Phycisphaerales bacterium]|nr:FAD-dependent oxidoreductase [Phycisphaerales bacterium]
MRPALGVAIVGGGFSGLMVAANLLRRGDQPVRITLIEPAERLGEGAAYATEDPLHLLNVPAKRMGAWADDHEHFYRWVCQRPGGCDPGSFQPRSLYAKYLRSVLDDAVERAGEGGSFSHVRERVVEIVREDGRLVLSLFGGGSVCADACVLALGLGPPASPPADPGLVADGRLIDPWTEEGRRRVAKIGRGERVLIVGSGLTMLDAAITLDAQGHRGPIDAVSVRGLIPRPHGPSGACPEGPPVGASLREQRRWMRGVLASGAGWRSAVDAYRPDAQRIWGSMHTRDRERFVRRLAPFWDVHRHRCAPDVHTRILAMHDEGRLRLHAARVIGLAGGGGKVRAELARGAGCLEAEVCLLCTGPHADPRAWSALVRGLAERGEVAPDPLGLGLLSDDLGRALDCDGRPTDLWLIGALRRGELWETTAVPELRVQAAAIASALVSGRTC